MSNLIITRHTEHQNIERKKYSQLGENLITIKELHWTVRVEPPSLGLGHQTRAVWFGNQARAMWLGHQVEVVKKE